MAKPLRFFLVLLFICSFDLLARQKSSEEKIQLLYDQATTSVAENEEGFLVVSISTSDLSRFNRQGFVQYSDFGAVGDGQSDDQLNIVASHAVANDTQLPVIADKEATYYIGGKDRKAIIQTDTDFGKAKFIIDDRNVINRNAPIFEVQSALAPIQINGLPKLQKGQAKLGISLPQDCLITVKDSTVRRYIRFGLNPNSGYPQTDIFKTDRHGTIDPASPIIWDFDQITEITALPIDSKPLKITGGVFTTLANQEESKYNYYSRNLLIRRSNVTIDGIQHFISGEGDHGAPYSGFITIQDCANVTVINGLFTGHKTYSTIGRADKPVNMGSYDLTVNRSLNVSFINCRQSNDINDRKFWGILGSNYSKNLLYDNCTLSRFDAHMGVANATIRNSHLGHMGINAIGTGTFLVENTTISSNRLINLRSDYGSTWEGEFIIKDCVFRPSNGKPSQAALIGGYNSGQHDFGYVCYMPEKITIENLTIEDAEHTSDYTGPELFGNFNPQRKDESYVEPFPYQITKKVTLKNIQIESEFKLDLSKDQYMFRQVEIAEK